MDDITNIKNKILELVEKYYNVSYKELPCDKVPVSGKVYDGKELKNLVEASLDGWWTEGEVTNKFEKKFCGYLGVKHTIVVNSGSSANLLALKTLTSQKLGDRRLKDGDEVITIAAGFPTTINPIIECNCIPVFCDVDLPTYNINIEQLKKAVSKKTKAVFLAHTLGNPFNIEEVVKLCKKHNLWLIEDNCDSLGSRYNNQLTGTFGDLSTHSFYPAHHMSCSKDTMIPYLNERGEWRMGRIEDIFNDYVDNPKKIKVISFDSKGRVGWTSPSSILRHKLGSKPMMRITSEHGRYVDVTVDHSVFVLESDTGFVVPKQASQIKKGDYIIATNNIPAPRPVETINLLDYFIDKNAYVSNFSHDNLKYVKNSDYRWQFKERNSLPIKYLKYYNIHQDKLMIGISQSQKIPACIEVDEGLCRLIGYFLAEGSYQDGIIFSFGAHETDLIEDVIELVHRIFGIIAYVRKNSVGKGVNIEVQSKNVEIVFRKAFGIERGADKKRIPWFLYHCDARKIKSFVYAYTCGDGSMRLLKDNTTRIDVTSVSQGILNDFQYLLSRIGISASFYRRNCGGIKHIGKVLACGRPNYSLCFGGYVYKDKTIVKSNLRNRNDISDQIPLLPAFRRYISVDKKQTTISRARLIKHLKQGTDIYNLMSSNLAFLKVREAKHILHESNDFVYDFSVPKKENFYGGFLGIFMHNTMGEGGAVCTSNNELAKIARSIRDWGRDCWCQTGQDNSCRKRFEWKLGELPYGYDHKYIYSEIGYNLKNTDLNVAIGLAQMEKLNGFIETRKRNFALLKDKLSKFQNYFILPEATENSDPSWFGFLITLKDNCPFERTNLLKYLNEKNIGTRMLFGGNITKQPYFIENKINYRVVDHLKNTDFIMNNTFWIGVYPGITDEMTTYVHFIFNNFMEKIK